MALTAPHVANLACDHCTRYLVSIDTGETQRQRDGRLIERKPGHGPPCGECPKCAHLSDTDRTPENAAQASDEVLRVYAHYRRNKAVALRTGDVDDGLVRHNAAILLGVEEDYDRYIHARIMTGQIAQLFSGAGGDGSH